MAHIGCSNSSGGGEPSSDSTPPLSAKVIDLSTVTTATTVQDGYTITGTLGGNYKISIADGAKVTLKDVTINGTNVNLYNWAGLTCAGDAEITLDGNSTVKGFLGSYPGIYVPESKTLTIKGNGSLTASSNLNAAGIGAGSFSGGDCGNITIEGGSITANAGDGGAGIGGGQKGLCGDITIKGGTITATGGQYAAGIGSGGLDSDATNKGNCGNIFITGGTVNATGGKYGPGIGAGMYCECGNISITGGTVTATATEGQGSGIGGGYTGSTVGNIIITNTVIKVTAITSYSAWCIGQGYGTSNCTCGTITIGGTDYANGVCMSGTYTYQP